MADDVRARPRPRRRCCCSTRPTASCAPARAQRTYEVTEVNEMLHGMERYAGIFVCTTNLFDGLDQAALRRFTFKIRFMPLTPEQRETHVRDRGAGRPTRRAERRAARAARPARPARPGRLRGGEAPDRHPGRGSSRPTSSWSSSRPSTASSPRCGSAAASASRISRAGPRAGSSLGPPGRRPSTMQDLLCLAGDVSALRSRTRWPGRRPRGGVR